MKKLLLLFALTTAFPFGKLLAMPNDNGGPAGQEPVRVILCEQPGKDKKLTVTRADANKQGVAATLQYVQLPDMKKPRHGHQTFIFNHHLYVVGGSTTGHEPTATAEFIDYTSSTPYWAVYETQNAHDGACIVKRYRGDNALPTTGYLICGGFSQNNGVGQITETCAPYYLIGNTIYGFVNGPRLSTPRAMAKGIYIKHKTYICGNYNGDDSTMEVLEEGATEFKPVGNTRGYYAPYMFADSLGRVTVMSRLDNYGKEKDYTTYEDGSQILLADRYDPSSDNMKDVGFPFTPQNFPMLLPADAKSTDYSYVDNGHHISFILSQQLTQNGDNRFWLHRLDMDAMSIDSYNSFIIPTKYAATGQYITWRGSVIISSNRHEVYLIGVSGPEKNQTLHIICFNYDNENWTMATAEGFGQDMLSASWTLLSDGRLACTGGYIDTTFDQEHTRAYIFTPPVAGESHAEPVEGDEAGDHVVIEDTNGETVSFLLSEDPHLKFNGQTVTVTTADVTIDYKAEEIARVYLTKSIPTGIDISELPTNKEGKLSIEEGRIVITGLQAGESACVYQLTGVLAATMKANQEGQLIISINDMPGKISIVKTKHQSFKIIRK